MSITLTTSNTPDLETLKKWDRLHQIHPWAAIDSWRGYDNMFVDSADGIYFWDGDGKRYIDGPGGIVLSQHFTFFINSVAHIWGSRPYTEKNTARDNGFLALFTCGEGYHNFHHIFASDYRNGIKWFHYDPTKWMIRSLAAVGLANKLKRTPVERIEKAKAETLMSKTQTRLAKLPLAQDKITLLQQEYDLLLKKLQNYCSLQKQVLEVKKK